MWPWLMFLLNFSKAFEHVSFLFDSNLPDYIFLYDFLDFTVHLYKSQSYPQIRLEFTKNSEFIQTIILRSVTGQYYKVNLDLIMNEEDKELLLDILNIYVISRLLPSEILTCFE